MAVDRIRTGSQAMYNSLSFYPGVPSVSRSPPFARPHRAATPKIAVSPAVTHTLVGPTLLVRFARPSLLGQDRRFTDCGTKAVPIAALRFICDRFPPLSHRAGFSMSGGTYKTGHAKGITIPRLRLPLRSLVAVAIR